MDIPYITLKIKSKLLMWGESQGNIYV